MIDAGARARGRYHPAVCGPRWCRRPVLGKGRRLWPFEHLRQPYESWWSIRPATCRWPVVRFFQRARAVGMDFDGGRIQTHGLDANAHHLLALQLLEDPIQHAVLGPAVDAGVDGVPRSEAFGQAAPLAAVLGHIEQGVQQLQVVDLYVAALAGKSGGNMLILRFGDLHAPQHITGLRLSINTS